MQKTEQVIHNRQGTGPRSSTLPISSPKPGMPDPPGLGRKHHLARPPQASGVSSATPDAPEARTQTPPRLIPSASGVSSVSPDPPQGSGAKRRPTRSRQSFRRTTPVPSTWQAQWPSYHSRAWWRLFQPPWPLWPYLFHYATLSLSLWCTASQ